ncbi:hypothetical protein [Foetidibacter luteolus]|uniref:hypothetical protein n=1 Tax=Foetidibacter luteolus TaxID=2608880 RepID=UPI00129ABEE4|nr:hypothetical protein [Foetidibacter luteolus]
MAKFTVPRNVEDLLKLANAIYSKHLADGGGSPLVQLEDYNLDAIGPNLQLAQAKHMEAEGYRRQAEKAIEERDKLMGDIAGVVKSSRDLLKAKFAKSPRKLGDWGFDVSDSTPGKKTTAEQNQVM